MSRRGASTAGSSPRKSRSAGRRAGRWTVALALALLGPVVVLLTSCSENGTQPGSLRFGQDGQIRIRIETPLGAGDVGTLLQTLEWRSTGQWRLVERISYRGEVGDSAVRRSEGDAAAYASSYASLITLLNEDPAVNLFTEEADPELDPECGPTRSRVAVRVLDEGRGRTLEWIRCGSGSFADLNPGDAGPPGTGSARVVQVARLARDFVLGSDFRSAYVGTVPFATLARREISADGPPEPAIFLGANGQAPPEWAEFWSTHLPSVEPPLTVDWSDEMVIVAAVGELNQAGHEVEVRRILQVDQGTRIEVFHRIPGDFCSPASGDYAPFHVVVAPRTTEPVRFQDHVRTEVFPCGV